MYMHDEAAFWALSQLLTHPKWLFHGFYLASPNMPKTERFLQALDDRVLRKLMPSLKKHLDAAEYTPRCYALGWCMQLFLSRVPFAAALHFWDVLLLEGDRAVLWFACVILRTHKKQLLASSLDQLEFFFKTELPNKISLPRDTVRLD
jgi:hypothetical protein